MVETFRWFGPRDKVPLSFIRQAGASGVVTALHQVPNGEVWEVTDIQHLQSVIVSQGLEWSVIESIPVHENIKLRQGDYKQRIENYKQSLRNAAACGLKTVCYNFMPVLDWTRTDLYWPLPHGGTALRFDQVRMAFFEGALLQRKDAESDYSPKVWERALALGNILSQKEKDALQSQVLMGLPGTVDDLTMSEFREMLVPYAGMTHQDLKSNLAEFLGEVIPVAEEMGMVMGIHPDDPPKDILGLPRIVKNGQDLEDLVGYVDSNANGLTFCTGSLGANPENDLPKMLHRFKERIHFLHLRNVKREEDGSFYEDNHLEGSSDMVEIVKAVNTIEEERGVSLPMRPDHGHQLWYDLETTDHYGGYSPLGRIKGLAELRGLTMGLQSLDR